MAVGPHGKFTLKLYSRSLRLIGLAVVVVLCLAACGGNDERGTNGAVVTPLPELTADQVCALVSTQEVAAALAADAVSAAPEPDGQPICNYAFTRDGDPVVVRLQVLRVAQPEGSEDIDPFDYVVELNRSFLPNASEAPIRDVGDQALYMDGGFNRVLVVETGRRILIVLGQALTAQSASDIARTAVEQLPSPPGL
jgi:hypothetical protein